MIRTVAAVFFLVAACLSAAPAAAERIVVSLSNHRVLVTSSFTGEELVLFGTIEPDATGERLGKSYDVVISVVGPRQTLRTRRKTRVAGIWINTESRVFADVPSYLAILSNRDVREVAGPDVLSKLQIGLDNTLLPQHAGTGTPGAGGDDTFRTAFIQLQTQHGVYRQESNAVTFLTPTVFRATIPLPADVATGGYAVDVQVFEKGVPIVRAGSALEVVKAGFEQYVATAAREHGLLYGLVTALMALLTGWFASVVFRRD